MNVVYKDFISNFPDGALFKYVGEETGITYYGELEDNIILLSCPSKKYKAKRFRWSSLGYKCVEIFDNDRDKNVAIKATRREYAEYII